MVRYSNTLKLQDQSVELIHVVGDHFNTHDVARSDSVSVETVDYGVKEPRYKAGYQMDGNSPGIEH